MTIPLLPLLTRIEDARESLISPFGRLAVKIEIGIYFLSSAYLVPLKK